MLMQDEAEWISMKEASERFHVSRATIQRWVNEGIVSTRRRQLGLTRVFVDAREIASKLELREDGQE